MSLDYRVLAQNSFNSYVSTTSSLFEHISFYTIKITRIVYQRQQLTFTIFFIFVRISRHKLQLLTSFIANYIKDLGPARGFQAILIKIYIDILKGIVRSITYIDINLANIVLIIEYRNWLFLQYQLKSQLKVKDVNID